MWLGLEEDQALVWYGMQIQVDGSICSLWNDDRTMLNSCWSHLTQLLPTSVIFIAWFMCFVLAWYSWDCTLIVSYLQEGDQEWYGSGRSFLCTTVLGNTLCSAAVYAVVVVVVSLTCVLHCWCSAVQWLVYLAQPAPPATQATGQRHSGQPWVDKMHIKLSI